MQGKKTRVSSQRWFFGEIFLHQVDFSNQNIAVMQGVQKILPDWKVDKVFCIQGIKSRHSEERVSVCD